MGERIFLVLLVAGVLGGFAVLYNRLVRLRNGSESAWSDIDVQLKRRHNLIPNLVETVKGYAQHEQKALTDVTAARTQATQAHGPGTQAGAENALTRAVSQLFAVAEAYPELKANQNFSQLQGELSAIETAIQNARRYYNAIVRDLNTACDAFPTNMIAGWFDIQKREYFELDSPEQREVPSVDFSS